MKVIKRDGRAVEYNREKIEIAIEKANKEVQEKGKINKNEYELAITKKNELIKSSNSNNTLMVPVKKKSNNFSYKH